MPLTGGGSAMLRLALRGGYYYAFGAGLFGLYFKRSRTILSLSVGFRPAFIL